MGCFLGCFGGDKDHRRRKHRIHRASPKSQRCKVENVQQESIVAAEHIITETPHIGSVSELCNKLEGEEQLSPSPSPRKRVTFNSNITTYEHVSLNESVESLPECNTNAEKEIGEDLKRSSQSHSLSDDNSVIPSVGSYPPNHRYHNSRESDDESEEYGDSDLDDVDEDYDDDYDEDEEDTGIEVVDQNVLLKTVNFTAQETNEKIESPMVNARLSDVKINAFGSKTNVRDRSDYFNSVLNPVENINQWKVVKSKGTNPLKPQKENLTANFEPPRLSFEPSNFKSKSDQLKNKNQEIAVDASLSNWLVTPEKPCGLETIASGKTVSEGSMKSFEDRPILGAWTVNELRQISAASSPMKSPSRSPDEMPIIGTVGTYWNNNHSGSPVKYSVSSASSYKGIPNTTSKYREDKRVNWHSTPFETRLDRALNRGAAEA